MNSLICRLRYALHMFSRIEGNDLKDWKFCWACACCAWKDLDGESQHPIESADEEMTYWR